mgnify:FL=1
MVKIAVILMLAGFIIMSVCAYAATDSGLAVSTTSCSFSEWMKIQPGNKL